jgi:ElaB/YqjD/DUF883 family membrane-anchored ribosome-binding protein
MNTNTDIRAEVRNDAQSAGGDLAPHTDKLAEDLRKMVSDAEGLLGQVQSLTGDAASAARIRLEMKMREVRAKLDAVHAAATLQARQAVDLTGGFVRREPILALGMAAFLGLFVGILVARR